MDIKNIVENSILKHLLTKEMPDEINISCTSKIDNHKYGIVTTVKDLAGEIADDIKKELKLVASGKCCIDDIENIICIGDDYETLDKFMAEYDRKNINIYIEEIDEQGKHQEG